MYVHKIQLTLAHLYVLIDEEINKLHNWRNDKTNVNIPLRI